MAGQMKQEQRTQPRGIPNAAIEGAEQAKRSLDPDSSMAQPGPGLSDVARESNPSAGNKQNPDVEKFHDGSNASPDDFEESEVLEE
jgi:hypothetical protein